MFFSFWLHKPDTLPSHFYFPMNLISQGAHRFSASVSYPVTPSVKRSCSPCCEDQGSLFRSRSNSTTGELKQNLLERNLENLVIPIHVFGHSLPESFYSVPSAGFPPQISRAPSSYHTRGFPYFHPTSFMFVPFFFSLSFGLELLSLPFDAYFMSVFLSF